jgi:predicted enzyme related to lactoylglutathione lyase
MLPNENEAVWRVAQTGSIYIVGDPDHAGRALLTLAVDDLDELVAGLADRGITGVIDSVPGAGRTVAVTDPDGNRIVFFAEPSTDAR